MKTYSVYIDGFVNINTNDAAEAVILLYDKMAMINHILARKYNVPVEAIKSIVKEERFRPFNKCKINTKSIKKVGDLLFKYKMSPDEICKMMNFPNKGYVDGVLMAGYKYPPTKETYAKVEAVKKSYIETGGTIYDISADTGINVVTCDAILRTLVIIDKINEDVIPDPEVRAAIRRDRAMMPKTKKHMCELLGLGIQFITRVLKDIFVSKINRDRSNIFDIIKKAKQGCINGLKKFRTMFKNATEKVKKFIKSFKFMDKFIKFIKNLFKR